MHSDLPSFDIRVWRLLSWFTRAAPKRVIYYDSFQGGEQGPSAAFLCRRENASATGKIILDAVDASPTCRHQGPRILMGLHDY